MKKHNSCQGTSFGFDKKIPVCDQKHIEWKRRQGRKKTFEQFYVPGPWSVPPYILMSVLVER